MTNRRQFMGGVGGGLVGLALPELFAQGRPRPHHPPRARAVIQLFMSGAASTCDMYDHKPSLEKHAGEPFDPGGRVELFQSSPGVVMPSPWKWRRHGESGLPMSSLVPRLAEVVDDLAFIRSMTTRTNVHGPATFFGATGFVRPGFPAAGAWLSWGLGSANDDLPTFVALPDERGLPPGGPRNWAAGFLPAEHQGITLWPGREEPLRNLRPNSDADWVKDPAGDERDRSLLAELGRIHGGGREEDDRLAARMRAFELTARLQLAAPEALDTTGESAATRRLYGLDDPVTADFGRRCLVARRLVERGVRFVQVWSGADNGFPRRNWDSHENLERDHGSMGRSMDGPAAALVADLKGRGLLDEVLVNWTTEFGRMPCAQGALGRDHNPDGFTCWLAGGGVRGGVEYGATDEWGYRAADAPVEVHDVHATMLHLLGFDHERMVVRHEGLDRRLTDVHGHVLTELLA